MRAAVLTAHGEPPTYAEHPDPTAPDGHALVRITASPVVPLDLLCASGTYGRAGAPKYDVPDAHNRSNGTTGDAVTRTSTWPSVAVGPGCSA